MTTMHNSPIRHRVLPTLVVVALAAGAHGAAAQAQPPAQAPAAAPAAAASLDAILKAASTYDGGIESAAMWQLRDYVYARKDDPKGRAECEAKLLQFLKTQASPLAKMAACRYLRIIGGDTAVPALAAMLGDVRSADMALYALQQMPGAAVDAALVRALKDTGGTTKTGVIVALGQRRTASAVPPLVSLLRDAAYAREAAVALSRIGGDVASAALLGAFGGASADLKSVLAGAMMSCAESALAAGNTLGAMRLYEPVLFDKSLSAALRRAAAMGKIAASGPRAAAVLVESLGSADPILRDAAVAKIAATIAPDGIDPVCALVPKLPEGTQVQVLAALAGYPPARVLPAVQQALKSPALPVRLAALKTLETVGGPPAVAMLAELAAGARGTEQAAARAALGGLKGRAVDDEILAQMGKKPAEDVEGELLLAAADRRLFPAKPIVAAALKSSSASVRQQALRSLRTLGTPSDVPAVLDLLMASADEAEQAECEKTISALSLKFSNADMRARAIRTRLMSEKAPGPRARLLAVLPLTADNTALPLLRTALADADAGVADAAVRALAAWPTPAAREDVLRLARESKDETHRLLAITGLVRLVGLEPYRNPAAAVADLKTALDLAWRPEERKLVLGALGTFPSREALDLATGLLKDPAVAAEAQAAIDRIKQRQQRF